MESDLPLEPTAETAPELGTLPARHGNTKHGLRSQVPIIRALLTDEEAKAWDAAPVPHDCSEALEEIFREYFVLKFRVHAWEHGQTSPGDVASLHARLRLLHIPLRGLLKSVEVHARIKESEQTHDMGDAVLAYLRTLPAHRLESYMLEGEAPRFDPVTGRVLTDVSRETGDDHDRSDADFGPGSDRESDRTEGAPDARGTEPGGGSESC